MAVMHSGNLKSETNIILNHNTMPAEDQHQAFRNHRFPGYLSFGNK